MACSDRESIILSAEIGRYLRTSFSLKPRVSIVFYSVASGADGRCPPMMRFGTPPTLDYCLLAAVRRSTTRSDPITEVGGWRRRISEYRLEELCNELRPGVPRGIGEKRLPRRSTGGWRRRRANSMHRTGMAGAKGCRCWPSGSAGLRRGAGSRGTPKPEWIRSPPSIDIMAVSICGWFSPFQLCWSSRPRPQAPRPPSDLSP